MSEGRLFSTTRGSTRDARLSSLADDVIVAAEDSNSAVELPHEVRKMVADAIDDPDGDLRRLFEKMARGS